MPSSWLASGPRRGRSSTAARRSRRGRGSEQRSTSKPSPAAPVCSNATGFRRRTSKPPPAAAVCAFGALALNQHELHELRATSWAPPPSRTARATKRTAKARVRTAPAAGREPKPRARAAVWGAAHLQPPNEPKTGNTAAFWVAHHADPKPHAPARQPAPTGRSPDAPLATIIIELY